MVNGFGTFDPGDLDPVTQNSLGYVTKSFFSDRLSFKWLKNLSSHRLLKKAIIFESVVENDRCKSM